MLRPIPHLCNPPGWWPGLGPPSPPARGSPGRGSGGVPRISAYVDHGRELLPHVGPVGVGSVGVGAVVKHRELGSHQVGSAAEDGRWPRSVTPSPLRPPHPTIIPHSRHSPGFAPDAKPTRNPKPTPSFPPFSPFLGFRAPLNRGVIGCCCHGDPPTPLHGCRRCSGPGLAGRHF